MYIEEKEEKSITEKAEIVEKGIDSTKMVFQKRLNNLIEMRKQLYFLEVPEILRGIIQEQIKNVEIRILEEIKKYKLVK